MKDLWATLVLLTCWMKDWAREQALRELLSRACGILNDEDQAPRFIHRYIPLSAYRTGGKWQLPIHQSTHLGAGYACDTFYGQGDNLARPAFPSLLYGRFHA